MKFTNYFTIVAMFGLSACSLASRLVGSAPAAPDPSNDQPAESAAPETATADNAGEPAMWAQLTNSTDVKVCEFYAQWYVHSPGWGPNLLAGKPLAPGASVRLDFPEPNQSDAGAVRALDCNGNQVMRLNKSTDFAFKPGNSWAVVNVNQAKPKYKSSSAKEVALKFDNRCGKTVSICKSATGKSGGGFVYTGKSEHKVWLGGDVRTSINSHCDHVLLKSVEKTDGNKTFILCK